MSFAKVEFNDVQVVSTLVVAEHIIGLDYVGQAKMNNFTVSNLTAIGITDKSVFDVSALPYGKAEFKEWKVENSQIQYQDLISFTSTTSGSIVVDNMHVNNILIGGMILKTSALNTFQITNLNTNGVNSLEGSLKITSIIYITAIEVMDFGMYLMENITIDNFAISFFRLMNINSNNVKGKALEMNSLLFKNYDSKSNMNIVSFENIEIESDFEIRMSNIEAANISYETSGYFFRFNHQMSSFLTLRN